MVVAGLQLSFPGLFCMRYGCHIGVIDLSHELSSKEPGWLDLACGQRHWLPLRGALENSGALRQVGATAKMNAISHENSLLGEE